MSRRRNPNHFPREELIILSDGEGDKFSLQLFDGGAPTVPPWFLTRVDHKKEMTACTLSIEDAVLLRDWLTEALRRTGHE